MAPERDPGYAELARLRLYLRDVDYSGPARPQSGSRSSAAAGCAHGNAAGTPGQCSSRRYRPRPSNCRHAPNYRLCHAPSYRSPPIHWVDQLLLCLPNASIAPDWQPIG
ncbi:Hypothetical predicted protein [Marmota monax]|uniref:Uncharacterized protein n=1 Tax=Marmota monax TaxID=9995 RepID=A0A5E4A3C7_MARMO|nr:hypothetical protein GHT09_001671 [Marmota monax]VTJ51707.1 Hypothetical predicted protein [Marmota monax]